jgi:hypothetical protein
MTHANNSETLTKAKFSQRRRFLLVFYLQVDVMYERSDGLLSVLELNDALFFHFNVQWQLRVMAQAFNSWPLSVEARVQFETSPREREIS